MNFAEVYSLGIGRTQPDSTTSETLAEGSLSQSILSAEDSRVRTCQAQVLAKVLLASARAYGVSSLVSCRSANQNGLSSRTSLVEQSSGSTPWCKTWDSLDMRRYRSRSRQAIAELCIAAPESSLLPTLTRTANLLAPSMSKWSSHTRLQAKLPTLTASNYGSNQGGGGGRSGQVRQSLRSLTGAPLNPVWCEWLMGFPTNWTQDE